MITKVSLKNWRSHKESTLEFIAGTNGLVGILGSGKSSVLDAICFALFGTFPNLQSKKLKLEDLIMKKPEPSNYAEVEVEFFSGSGEKYSVKRVIEKAKGTSLSELKQNGKVIESPSPTRVTEVVEKVLKINYDLFSKAIYSEQNSLDYFLTIAKGQRMKRIDELLMIDKFEKARMNTVSLINKLAERKTAKQTSFEQIDVEKLQRMIEDLNNSILASESERKLYEDDLQNYKTQRESLERDYTNLSNLRAEIETLRREDKGYASAMEQMYVSLEKFERSSKNADKEGLEKSFKEVSKIARDMEGILSDKRKDYERIQEQATRARTEAEFVRREKLDRLESELAEKMRAQEILDRNKKLLSKDLEKDIEEKKLLIERLVGEVEVFKIKIRDLQEVISELQSSESKCPICDSKLTEERKILLIKKRAFDIEKFKEKLVSAARKKEAGEEDLKNLEEAANKLDEMLETVKDLDKIKTELDNTKNVYAILSESSTKLEEEMKQLRRFVEETEKKFLEISQQKQQLEFTYSQINDYLENKGRFSVFSQKLEEVRLHLREKESIFAGRNLGDLEIELRKVFGKEKELEVKISGAREILQEKHGRLKDYENMMSIATKEKEEVAKLERILQELKKFELGLKKTQEELRKEFVTSVNFTMNTLWADLYPYQDFIGIKLAIEESDYVLQLQERTGSWVNVEGFASGGERSLAALTLRIAFALVLAPQLKWLVLDEPTANLDAKSVEDLAFTLSDKIGNFIDQVFLITHDERLENAITGNLYKFERDKARDGATNAVLVM